MALQSLNIGTAANDGTGDNLRVGGDKINDNFSEIYTAFGDGSTLSSLAITGLNSATANELVTVGATTTELDAESNLTFDGSTLAVTGAVTVSGLTTLSGNLVIPDAGNIGSASDTDAIAIASSGVTTFSQKDVHSVGLSVKNGSTSAGFVEFFENSGNGTNKVTLIGPASTSDVTLTLGSTTGTIATTADIAGEATALAIAFFACWNVEGSKL